MSHQAHYSIIIVGAGPTGLTLANLLGPYGVDVLLVERNPATVSEPRAVSIDDESLRTMQAAGVIESILPDIVSGYGSEYFSPGGHLFLKVRPQDQPYGHPRRNAFRQPALESQLRAALTRYPNITTIFSCNLRDFTEHDDTVRVRLEGATSANIGCNYLIACDGASSVIRTQLGINMEGKSFDERWLIIDLENSPAPSDETYVCCDSRRPFIALPGPHGTRRFEFKLHSHENADDMLRPEVVAELLARGNTAAGSKLVRKCVYRFHARLARRWSSASGRVLLAGDAAHLTPPFAGQGMNSGVRDAHNLAWKLGHVVTGRLGPKLLDSYEIERRDHVSQMIQLALRMGRIMAPRNAFVGWMTQWMFRVLAAWPRVRDYFAEMKYKPQPRFNDGFLIRERHRGRHALVGRLLPQPRVRRAQSHDVLFDEVLDTGFALLCHADGIESMQKLCERLHASVALRCVAIAKPGGQAGMHADVEIVSDASGRLLCSLEQYRGQALLIRPDHYVAAALPLDDVESAARQFERLVTGTWEHGVNHK